MVLSGDTSGAVTLTVPLVAGTNTITFPASTGTVLTTANSGQCMAWVCYNGVGQAIRASYNVSSVTYNGTGNYIVNFTNAMADANYATIVNGTLDINTGTSQYFAGMTASAGTPTTKTTTQVGVASINSAFGYTNTQQMSVAVFR